MSSALPSLPPSSLLFGSLPEFRQDPLGTLSKVRDLGDLVRIRFGPRWAFIVSHPDLIREILVGKASAFDKSDRIKRILGDILGHGLLTSDGELWRRQRRMIQPAFHAQRIEAYAETMVGQTNSMLDVWQTRPAVDISHEMMRLTLGIVARTLFNASLEDREFDQVARAMETAQDLGNRRFARVFDLPRWLPTAERRRGQAAVSTLDRIVLDMIQTRREHPGDRGDLLSMLLLSEDDEGRRMGDQQVRDEAMTLFLAGHETTALALTWAWVLLARHPEVEAAVKMELARVLKGKPPTVSDLERLPRTEMVLNEALRLYPPAWAFSRQANRTVELDGAIIGRGRVVIISPYAVHRDERWYPSPDTFDPERFSPQRSQEIPRYAFIPFGGGPRICIGNAFAMLEARLVLATILSRCSLRLEQGTDLSLDPLITLRPAAPMQMRVLWDASS